MLTEEIIKEDQTPIEDYEKLLGVGGDYIAKDVLESFEKKYLILKPNNELDDFQQYIEAKNVLVRSLVQNQMRNRRYFEISSPFKNICPVCKSTGEIYKFHRKTVKVNCHICAGNKKVTVKCRACDGTGRFRKRWKTGGGINVSCRVCDGKGEVTIKCINCRGKGKIRKVVTDHEIKSTTPCRKCKGLGFLPPKPLKVLDNPVISINLGDVIKEQLIQPDPVPEMIEEVTAEPDPIETEPLE